MYLNKQQQNQNKTKQTNSLLAAYHNKSQTGEAGAIAKGMRFYSGAAGSGRMANSLSKSNLVSYYKDPLFLSTQAHHFYIIGKGGLFFLSILLYAFGGLSVRTTPCHDLGQLGGFPCSMLVYCKIKTSFTVINSTI